jgi:hypothetical protein
MAISFIPDQTGDEFVIGGQSTIGPFPKYSVSRSTGSSGDGTTLNNAYTITINGQFIVDSDVDIGTAGARQSNYNQKIIQRLSTLRQYYSNYGRLEITPYGGQPHKLIWNDAKLINVEVPESSDESSSILFGAFTFTFEAYTEVSILGTPDSNFSSAINEFDYNKFYVSSVDESWDMSIDDEFTYANGDVSGVPNKTYTVTHTVSATGLRKPLPAGGFDTSAWREAQRWTQSRLVNSPADTQTTDVMGGQNFTDFAASYFGNTSTETSTDLSSYSFYNHMRVPNVDIAGGSYSVTETWKATANPSATIDLNVDIDISENEMVSMTASGSVQGLDSQSLNAAPVRKIDNAQAVFESLSGYLYDLCSTYYNELNTGGALSNIVKAKSIGKNAGTGVITFSFAYNDTPILINDAITTGINISYDNKDYQVQLVAIIAIIGKQQPEGPVIQDMNTSRERKKSVQLDATIKRAERVADPKTEWSAVALSYKPSIYPHYVQNFSENWDPITGGYSVSVEWTY